MKIKNIYKKIIASALAISLMVGEGSAVLKNMGADLFDNAVTAEAAEISINATEVTLYGNTNGLFSILYRTKTMSMWVRQL